jgi:hypothetical protein
MAVTNPFTDYQLPELRLVPAKDREGWVTTQALGEEGGDGPVVTTLALGEEGGDGPVVTTLALGEEGGDGPIVTTQAWGEESGCGNELHIPEKRPGGRVGAGPGTGKPLGPSKPAPISLGRRDNLIGGPSEQRRLLESLGVGAREPVIQAGREARLAPSRPTASPKPRDAAANDPITAFRQTAGQAKGRATALGPGITGTAPAAAGHRSILPLPGLGALQGSRPANGTEVSSGIGWAGESATPGPEWSWLQTTHQSH